MKSFPLVKCPYCFQTLKFNDAVFRCNSGVKSVDEHLKSYNMENGNEAFEREDFGYVDPADLKPIQITFDKEKHITGVENPNLAMHQPLTQRLCPFCHNNLLKTFGKKETRYIAVVGVPNSGKTTYLAAVNSSLKDKLWNWSSLNSEQSSPLDIVTDLYRANQLKTKVATESIQGPYFYSLNYTDDITLENNSKKSANQMESHVVFFDVPGEFYSNADKISNSLENFISRADGIIFIVNAAEEVEHERALRNGNTDKIIRVTDILEAFAQVEILGNKKTAIIFNKIDLIENEIALDSRISIFPKSTDGPVNQSEIKELSDNTISLILGNGSVTQNATQNALNRYMRKIMQVFGKECRVFATHLIKEIPEEDEESFSYKFNSVGAETPFLWLLSQIGAFPSVGTDK